MLPPFPFWTMMTVLPIWPESQGRLAEAEPGVILSRILYTRLSPAIGGRAPISGWRMRLQNPEPASWVGSMARNNAPGPFLQDLLASLDFYARPSAIASNWIYNKSYPELLCVCWYPKGDKVSSESPPQKGCLECLWPQIPLHMEDMKIGLVAPTERKLGEYASSA